MSHLLEDFKKFLDHSPTSWHAAQEICNRLAAVDFSPLEEGEAWILESDKKYFIQRGGFVCAFSIPKVMPKKITLLASHTDSPALKLKPRPEIQIDGITLFETEVYGSPILSSWFNRDLALAGRVIFQNAQDELEDKLLFLNDSPLILPQLALHLDKEAQKENGLIIDKQDHLRPILTLHSDSTNILDKLLKRHLNVKTLISFDLFLVPLEEARFVGLQGEMISAYRLDNLASAHACCVAIATAPVSDALQMALFWDHEEIGSSTTEGADSSALGDILKRISLALSMPEEEMIRLKTRSLCISVDVAHAFNPNFPSKYDPEHKCLLGHGIALKYNANKKYATDAKTAATCICACQKEKIPYQTFTSHSNTSCGSTVGPLIAKHLGIPTVDIGCPILSMHSVREVMASQDHLDMCRLLTGLLHV
jgi:aspartyl aminopeptidase